MKIHPGKRSLMGLIDDARSGRVVLPQFQRNFVWSRDDITALLVSILHDYFIGSFLLLRTDSDNVPFAMRPIEGVSLIQQQARPDWMVLDGQQRLTSLHYVFAAPAIPLRWTKYPYRFFLDLKKLAAGDLDEAIWSERSDSIGEWLQREKQFETLMIPFSEIEQWDNWRDAYEDWLWKQDDEAKAGGSTSASVFASYREQYRRVWGELVGRIRAFEVPTIEIEKIAPDDADGVSQVCAIFEKMNSTGVRLSVYDLLTARLYRYGIDLHQLWQEAVEQHDLLNSFSEGRSDIYGVFLLRVVALLRGSDVKSQTIINLAPQNFEAEWRRAAFFMERALQRMTSTNADGFGVFDPKWMPYSTMISPMAALLAKIDEGQLDHRSYKLVRRWYWASVFRERYAGAVESIIYRDYQDLLAAFKGDPKTPEALANAEAAIVNNPKFTLLEVNRLNAIYRGTMCLVAIRGAKDFQADDSIEFHVLDDHHIFPKAHLAKARRTDGSAYPNDLVNCVVNRTLISSTTNRRISRLAPSQYLEKLVPVERVGEIMESHFIEAAARTAMQHDDFEDFLLYREKAFVDEIRRQLTL